MPNPLWILTGGLLGNAYDLILVMDLLWWIRR